MCGQRLFPAPGGASGRVVGGPYSVGDRCHQRHSGAASSPPALLPALAQLVIGVWWPLPTAGRWPSVCRWARWRPAGLPPVRSRSSPVPAGMSRWPPLRRPAPPRQGGGGVPRLPAPRPVWCQLHARSRPGRRWLVDADLTVACTHGRGFGGVVRPLVPLAPADRVTSQVTMSMIVGRALVPLTRCRYLAISASAVVSGVQQRAT